MYPVRAYMTRLVLSGFLGTDRRPEQLADMKKRGENLFVLYQIRQRSFVSSAVRWERSRRLLPGVRASSPGGQELGPLGLGHLTGRVLEAGQPAESLVHGVQASDDETDKGKEAAHPTSTDPTMSGPGSNSTFSCPSSDVTFLPPQVGMGPVDGVSAHRNGPRAKMTLRRRSGRNCFKNHPVQMMRRLFNGICWAMESWNY